MVKFLREIRHSQMTQGKTKWYLIYALGEVLLVVLGILIALQVNNWNENRKNAKLERSILENLQAELNVNLEELEAKIRRCGYSIRADSILISCMGPKSLGLAPEEIDSLLRIIRGYTTFGPADGVMKNLFNSGNINVIRNEELKFILSSWDRNLNEVKEVELWNSDFIRHILSPYLYDNILIREVNKNTNLGRSSFSWQSNTVLADEKFENLVMDSMGWSRALVNRYMILKEEILKMSNIIEGELDSR